MAKRIAPTLPICLTVLLFLTSCSDVDLPGGSETTTTNSKSEWTMLGGDLASTFHNRAEQKISPENVGELRKHWEFKPAAQANGTPAIVDGVVYATSNGGSYALDADSGQVLWQNLDLRATSSPTFDDGSLFIHGVRGDLARLDAGTGTVVWTTRSDENPFTSGYSSPTVVDRYVIVGVSSNEEGTAASDATFRGAVVAFDRQTGERLWRHDTAVAPYNGVGVWSTVTIDMETRRVFATSGNNYTGTGRASLRCDLRPRPRYRRLDLDDAAYRRRRLYRSERARARQRLRNECDPVRGGVERGHPPDARGRPEIRGVLGPRSRYR